MPHANTFARRWTLHTQVVLFCAFRFSCCCWLGGAGARARPAMPLPLELVIASGMRLPLGDDSSDELFPWLNVVGAGWAGRDRAAAAVEAHAGRGATTCCAICESRLRPAIAVACPVVKCRMYQRPSRWSGRAVRRQGLVACQPGSVAPCLSRISDSRSEHLMISGVWVRRMAPLWFGGFGGVGVGDITATRSAAKPAGQHANRASRGPRGFNLRDAPSEQRLVPPTFWHSSLAMLKERSERRRKSRRAGEGREGQLCRRHSGGQDADRSGRCARFIRASRVPSRSFSSSDVTRPLWLHVAAISLPRSTESRALPLVQLPPLRATPLQARAGRTFSVTHRREATAEGLLISWPKHGAGLLSSHRRQSSLSSALA